MKERRAGAAMGADGGSGAALTAAVPRSGRRAGGLGRLCAGAAGPAAEGAERGQGHFVRAPLAAVGGVGYARAPLPRAAAVRAPRAGAVRPGGRRHEGVTPRMAP